MRNTLLIGSKHVRWLSLCCCFTVLVSCALFLFPSQPEPESIVRHYSQKFTTSISCSPHPSWTFVEYLSSEWEKTWNQNLDQRRERICETLDKESKLRERFIRTVMKWSDSSSNSVSVDADSVGLFSRMIYKSECSDDYVAVMIEPLVGMLRDPFTMCPRTASMHNDLWIQEDEARVQSKRFLLLGVAAPFMRGSYAEVVSNTSTLFFPPFATSEGRNILFDLGSNYFDSWTKSAGASSTSYFYEFFKARGLSWDRIFAFEYETLDPHRAWNVVPDELVTTGVYSFINHGVDSEDGSKFNPWTMLRKIATASDKVVVKLDIDTPMIENALVEQLQQDPDLIDLVDEMFYEHHVYIREMEPWWQIPNRPGNPTIQDSYDIFTNLRRKGIRMHSWP